jgi:hypothetical protein
MNAGHWMMIFRRGKVFIPTMARTTAGFYLAVDPVEVVNASDSDAIESAFLKTIQSGHPTVPTPSRDGFPEWVVLKYAGVKSAATFERLAKSWALSIRGENYALTPYRPFETGGSVEDTEQVELIPIATPLPEVVRRLVNKAKSELAES